MKRQFKTRPLVFLLLFLSIMGWTAAANVWGYDRPGLDLRLYTDPAHPGVTYQLGAEPIPLIMVQRGASDLFLSPGSPVHLKVDGVIAPLSREPLSGEQVDELAQEFMEFEAARVGIMAEEGLIDQAGQLAQRGAGHLFGRVAGETATENGKGH